jgi:hypothetical protein
MRSSSRTAWKNWKVHGSSESFCVMSQYRTAELTEETVSRSGRPFADYLLPLLGAKHQLAEAVQRCIQSQEAVDDAREQVHANPDELLFVEFHLHPRPARERNAVIRYDTRECLRTLDRQDSFDLLLRVRRIREIIQLQDLLQRLFTFLHQ